MKCKLSKLFFLALIGAVSVNGYSQTAEGRKKIIQDYDLVFLNKLAKEFDAEFKQNYAKALEIAKQKNLPISGVDDNGAYFSLKGVDEETGEIMYFTTYNNSVTKSSIQTARAQHLYNGGSLGLNIQGQLMTLGIWDGGQPQASHENLGISRVVNKDGEFTTNSGQTGIDHATHVAGTMIGNGSVKSEARGLAFQGFLWANTWENDIAEMTLQAGQGLLVSNHSYGARNDIYAGNNYGVFGKYTSGSRAIDVLTSNAPNYLPVIAAGNDRNTKFENQYLNASKNGYDLLTHDAVSKNAVVVAAIDGFTSYTNAGSVIMSDFSQWGPTDDFRIKPDISAKGIGVYSSNMPSASSENSYASYPGTSMAAPAVTAVFALWQQYFKELNSFVGLQNMKAASLKALMAHTASEAGVYKDRVLPPLVAENVTSPEGPDPRFGWGVINAEGGAKVLRDAFSDTPTAVFKELVLSNGVDYVLDVTLNGTEKLNATIAWTDLPAEAVSIDDSVVPVLVNDLDLRIYGPGDTSMSTSLAMPYRLNKSWIGAGPYVTKGDNDVDPIEKITYYSDFNGLPDAGAYKIKISHKGSLTGGTQKVTLIVTGGVVSFAEPNVSSEQFKFDNLSVYPNPATDVLNLTADYNSIENAKVSIYDMMGKKVYQNDSLFSFSGNATVDVSNFSTGVYLVQILKDGKVDTRKIVKK